MNLLNCDDGNGSKLKWKIVGHVHAYACMQHAGVHVQVHTGCDHVSMYMYMYMWGWAMHGMGDTNTTSYMYILEVIECLFSKVFLLVGLF